MNKSFLNLSTLKIYYKLIDYNKQIGKHILNENIDDFLQEVQDFIDSGIMDNPHYNNALTIYRYIKRHYYFNGIPADIIFDELNENWYFRDIIDLFPDEDEFIADLVTTLDDFLNNYNRNSEYSYSSDEKINSYEKARRQDKIDAIINYTNLYNDFINSNADDLHSKYNTQLLESIEYKFPKKNVKRKSDTEFQHNIQFVKREFFENYIEKMINIRSQYIFESNFTLLGKPVEELREKISRAKTYKEKLQIIKSNIENIYEEIYKDEEQKNFTFRNFIKLDNYENEIITDYLVNVMHVRKELYFKIKKGETPEKLQFYIALAFYLCVPTSVQLEKFLNKFGYSLSNPVQDLNVLTTSKNETYVFYTKDLKNFVDTGIDYATIADLIF